MEIKQKAKEEKKNREKQRKDKKREYNLFFETYLSSKIYFRNGVSLELHLCRLNSITLMKQL